MINDVTQFAVLLARRCTYFISTAKWHARRSHIWPINLRTLSKRELRRMFHLSILFCSIASVSPIGAKKKEKKKNAIRFEIFIRRMKYDVYIQYIHVWKLYLRWEIAIIARIPWSCMYFFFRKNLVYSTSMNDEWFLRIFLKNIRNWYY